MQPTCQHNIETAFVPAAPARISHHQTITATQRGDHSQQLRAAGDPAQHTQQGLGPVKDQGGESVAPEHPPLTRGGSTKSTLGGRMPTDSHKHISILLIDTWQVARQAHQGLGKPARAGFPRRQKMTL
jgi:hypothetical protein